MSDREYFDKDFVPLPAKATVGDALAELWKQKAGDTWHIFVELGEGQFGTIWVRALREWFEQLGASLFDLRLGDLPLVIQTQAIPKAWATLAAPSRLHELAKEEPAQVFIIIDEEGSPVGRTWMASMDVFPGSTMGQLYHEFITEAPDARGKYWPAGVKLPICSHCNHQDFYAPRVEDGVIRRYCTNCGKAMAPRRVPTFKFFHCGNNENCDNPEPWLKRALQAKHWYRLDVAIKPDVEEGHIQPVDRERDVVPLPKKVPEDATLFISVSEEYGLFEFANQTASLKLTPEGISDGSAQFRLSPRDISDNPVPLTVRLYYKTNLLQRLSILVKVVGTHIDEVSEDRDAQRYKVEEVRDIACIPTLSPVEIHLDIDRSEQQSGTYTLAVKVDKVELFGTGEFATEDFEDWINQARDVLYEISSDYVSLREAIKEGKTAIRNGLYNGHIKALATIGRRIWTQMFDHPQSPDLQAISNWWRENRPPTGSVVQIDLRGALDFVVPWGLVFDSKLRPTIDAELRKITLGDFWGMRYQIEHNIYGASSAEPPVYSTDDRVSLAMMIGAEPVGMRHFTQMKDIAKRTENHRLAVDGPIEKPSEARNLFNMDASPTSKSWSLVYFIGHAYTRKATALDIRDGLDMFCKWYKERPNDPERARYAETAKVFCTEKFGGKYSFFNLTGGRVRHEDELDIDMINLQKTRPLVFFNACQSAQNSPSPAGGWVHKLISRGAGGYLGTEIFIDAQFAQEFGTAFWEAFLSGMTVGKAVLTVRQRFAEQKMLQGLAYTHYGPAGVRLKERILSDGDGESDR